MRGSVSRETSAPVRRHLGRIFVLAGLAFWGLASTATAQLSEADLTALREQGRREGWTFEIGENEATQRPLSELCGQLDTPCPYETGEDEYGPPPIVMRSLPSAFDWRDYNGCTSIRNQGGCGSCWAFSAVGAVECSLRINEGLNKNLSEQWLVSCTDAGSCSGGWHNGALSFMRCRGNNVDSCGDNGAVLESSFPYVGWDAPCGCPYSHPYCIDGFGLVGGQWDITAIKQAIYEYGPVSTLVAVDGAFQGYNGGVFNSCQGTSLNHAVVLVGWDDSMGSNGVWILRNSWGTWWGDDGYMYIEYGCNKVGSSTYCVYYRYDCNDNGIRDDWDLADCDGSAWCDDCDGNEIIDECDILKGRAHDCDQNGTPDECEMGFSGSGRLYVDAAATGSGDGSNWANALDSFWTASCYAATTEAVTEIWVAKGTYVAAGPMGSRWESIELRNGLAIRGGFAGYETSLDQRDLSNPANRTILTGDLNGDDLPGGGNMAENSLHVVRGADTDETAILDGFTIIGGNADEQSPDDSGGGIYLFNANPTILNCALLGNRATQYGGAMRNKASEVVIGTCTPTLVNCLLSGNHADWCGGAISSLGHMLGPAAPTLINCTVCGNTAEIYAGMYSEVQGAPEVTNTILWGNTDILGQSEMSQIGGCWPVINYSCVQAWSGDLGASGTSAATRGSSTRTGPTVSAARSMTIRGSAGVRRRSTRATMRPCPPASRSTSAACRASSTTPAWRTAAIRPAATRLSTWEPTNSRAPHAMAIWTATRISTSPT